MPETIFNINRFILLLILFLLFTKEFKSQDFNLNGQISSWGTGVNSNNAWNGEYGLRYIPQFNYSYNLDDNDLLNVELMLNSYFITDFTSSEVKLKPYRIILRYTTKQSETQIGLQKINFGPARLLRPLMWFDRIDPRDPLRIADGVYAIRFKYSFLNNTLLWLWCLYGNKDNKGYELLPTEKRAPEVGGRIQLPAFNGEIGAAFHTRRVDASLYYYWENRYALDGHWDVGIGLWFEAAWQQNISNLTAYKLNRMTTIGADYTIPVGNGIYLLAEHMQTTFSKSFWTTNQSRHISAAMFSYSIGTLDNLIIQEYYDWSNKNIYQNFQFQRSYDNLIINLSLFHYPENEGNLFLNDRNFLLSGYGLQLLLAINY